MRFASCNAIFTATILAVALTLTGTPAPTGALRAGQPPQEDEQTPQASAVTVADKKIAKIRFDDLRFKVSKNEPISLESIPRKIMRLSGTSIQIRGYIYPTSIVKERGIKTFALVRDNQEHYPWPIHDQILVRMVDGRTANFTVRPITLEGKFRVTDQYKFPDGRFRLIYELKAHSIQYTPPAGSR